VVNSKIVEYHDDDLVNHVIIWVLAERRNLVLTLYKMHYCGPMVND